MSNIYYNDLERQVKDRNELISILCDEKIKLISFDCFDTLLCWLYQESHDLTWEVNDLDIDRCNTIRSVSNEYMRKLNDKELSFYNINYSQIKDLKNKELECKKNQISKRLFWIDIIQILLNNNKKIILTSDMFFNTDDIRYLLICNNLNVFHKMYISSDYHKTKRSGELFKQILSDFNEYKPENIIHIGDNIQSDFYKARELGINSIIVKKPIDIVKESSFNILEVWDFQLSNYDRLLYGYAINNIADNPFIDNNQLSYNIFVWLSSIYFFTSFYKLNEMCLEKHIDKLYLLYSDGYIVKMFLNNLSKYTKVVDNELVTLSRCDRISKIYKNKTFLLNNNDIFVNYCELLDNYDIILKNIKDRKCSPIDVYNMINKSEIDILDKKLDEYINKIFLKDKKYAIYDYGGRYTLLNFLKFNYNITNCIEIHLNCNQRYSKNCFYISNNYSHFKNWKFSVLENISKCFCKKTIIEKILYKKKTSINLEIAKCEILYNCELLLEKFKDYINLFCFSYDKYGEKIKFINKCQNVIEDNSKIQSCLDIDIIKNITQKYCDNNYILKNVCNM